MRRLRGNRGVSEHRSHAGASDLGDLLRGERRYGTACLFHRGGGDAGE